MLSKVGRVRRVRPTERKALVCVGGGEDALNGGLPKVHIGAMCSLMALKVYSTVVLLSIM